MSAANTSFVTSRIEIRGATLRVHRDITTIFMVDARVVFRSPMSAIDQFYHVEILPSSATLFLVFHDVGVSREIARSLSADDLHLVVVRQDRWAADAMQSPEPPGGQSEDNEDLRTTAWREAREEIGAALFDKLCQDFSDRPVTAEGLMPFYTTLPPDTNLTGYHVSFACVLPVTTTQLDDIRGKISRCHQAGVLEEGEQTRAALMSLPDVLETTKIGVVAHTLIHFLRYFSVPIPALADVRELYEASAPRI